MLLYIHVPFCREKCHYCGFFSIPVGQNHDDMTFYEPFQAWRRSILAEARFYVPFLHASLGTGTNQKETTQTSQKVRIDSIFFGGGTPSLIPPKELAKILKELAKIFDFSPNIEVSMEANPESIKKENARAYFQVGINRISLGAQSLNDNDLARLGRIHTYIDFNKAFYALRDAGFSNINIDLMWGLPEQRRKDWFKQLEDVITMQPKHLSCYGLSIDEGSSFYAMEEELNLPLEKELSAMYMDGAAILEEAGYLQYEISNFAKMGYQCRHNVAYWEGESYLGLGPSATSTLSMPWENWKNMGLDDLPAQEATDSMLTIRWTNPADLEAWSYIVKNQIPCPEKEILSKKEKVLELLMLRLRTVKGLPTKEYEILTGRNFFEDHKKLIHVLHRNGLLRIQKGYVRLNQNGLLVSNVILEHFFESIDDIFESVDGMQGKHV